MEEDNQDLISSEAEVPLPKPVRLSLHLIQKRHIQSADQLRQEEIIEALNKITHLRLDRENIGEIDGLELLGDKVTNVYLQMNRISKIQNLECLKNLTFLMLAGNQISRVEGLLAFTRLTFLDLEDNCVEDYDLDDFPKSLVILNLKGNPCASLPNHRRNLIHHLEKLRQLDKEEVTKEELREIGLSVSSDEEDEEEEEEEEDVTSANTRTSSKDNVQNFASKLLLRSQKRSEQNLNDHMRHTSELDMIRESAELPESVRNYTPCQTNRSAALESR